MNGVSVVSLGNDEYRITWPEPVKFDMKMLLLAGMHLVRVLSQEEDEDKVIGVEGEREMLLSWLRSLEMIDEENMKLYEEAMTASVPSGPEPPQDKKSRRRRRRH